MSMPLLEEVTARLDAVIAAAEDSRQHTGHFQVDPADIYKLISSAQHALSELHPACCLPDDLQHAISKLIPSVDDPTGTDATAFTQSVEDTAVAAEEPAYMEPLSYSDTESEYESNSDTESEYSQWPAASVTSTQSEEDAAVAAEEPAFLELSLVPALQAFAAPDIDEVVDQVQSLVLKTYSFIRPRNGDQESAAFKEPPSLPSPTPPTSQASTRMMRRCRNGRMPNSPLSTGPPPPPWLHILMTTLCSPASPMPTLPRPLTLMATLHPPAHLRMPLPWPSAG